MTGGYRLLIADDEPIEREAVRFFVSSYGRFAECEEAADGPAAVEAASRIKPDVMIMDIRMPGMDGIEAARAVRHFDRRVRIVFLTAFGDLDYARAAFKVDAADFLLKPVAEEAFREAMDRAIADLLEAGAGEGGASTAIAAARDSVARVLESIRRGEPEEASDRARSFFADHDGRAAGLSEARRIAGAVMDELERELRVEGVIGLGRVEEARARLRRARDGAEVVEAVIGLVACLAGDMGELRSDPRRKAIEAALAYVDSGRLDAISLEEAGRIAGMSQYHFSRVFHAATGMTFGEYARRKRVELAKRLLADPSIPIKRVCDMAGFSTPAYFASAFKRSEGISPSEYRSLHRRGSRKPLIDARGVGS